MIKATKHATKIVRVVLCAVIVALIILIMFLIGHRPEVTDGESHVVSEQAKAIERIEQLFSVETIPKIYLTSDIDMPDRHNYSPVSVRINDDTESANSTNLLSGGIRTRGNSTYSLSYEYGGPMPYKIKLNQKANLLGMGEHKKWNLITNFYDRSYVKQFVAYASAASIYGADRYQPEAKFVEVYYNDDYRGLYLLSESIEEDDGALDIETDLSNYGEDVPFLVDMDSFSSVNAFYSKDKTELKKLFDTTMFYGNAQYESPTWLLDSNPTNDSFAMPQPYILKYPKSFKDISEVQAKNIKKTVRTLYSNAAKAPIESLGIDVGSFTDVWIFCELFANSPCYYGPSSYMYRSTGESPVVLGPLWDFDQALRQKHRTAQFFTRPDDTINPLISSLYQNPEFIQAISARYAQVYKDVLPHINKGIMDLKDNQILKAAVLRAESKYDTWHRSFSPEWDNGADYEDENVLKIDTYEEHVQYVYDGLFGVLYNGQNRVDWLYENRDEWGKAS